MSAPDPDQPPRVPRRDPRPTTLFDPDAEGLAAVLDELAPGLPAYRARQLWDGLYQRLRPVDELSDLPATLRAAVAGRLPTALEPAARSVSDDGRTLKFLWTLDGGAAIETVLMHYDDRSTVCVSTQAGCAMACSFCATGQAGFERQLSVGEIVEQVVRAAREAAPRRVSNIVFMGMGEPMANYDATWGAVERLHGAMGISARHLTISTVGIVGGIRRLATEALPVNLAVSLHAATDAKRDPMVPINRRYPLAELADACHEYLAAKNRRLSFEWAVIDGVNDTAEDAAELAAYARPLRAHVNLIPLNPTPGYPVRGSSPARVRRFRDQLTGARVNATIRANRGTEIDAACGQLRATHTPPAQRGRSGRADPGDVVACTTPTAARLSDVYRFSSSNDPGEHWFRVGTVDVTSTVLVTALGVISMFVYAASPALLSKVDLDSYEVRRGQVWRVVTWPLPNSPSIYAVLGLLVFWYFGREVERTIGKSRFTWFLLALAMIPAAVAVAVFNTATGGVYLGGIGLVGDAMFFVFVLMYPGAKGFFGIPLWVFGAVVLGVDVLGILGARDYETLLVLAALLVTALFGARAFGISQIIDFVPKIPLPASRGPKPSSDGGRRARKAAKGGATVTPINRDREGPHIDRASQADMDRLLDKISASGVSSLTPEERRRLDEHSRRLRGQ